MAMLKKYVSDVGRNASLLIIEAHFIAFMRNYPTHLAICRNLIELFVYLTSKGVIAWEVTQEFMTFYISPSKHTLLNIRFLEVRRKSESNFIYYLKETVYHTSQMAGSFSFYLVRSFSWKVKPLYKYSISHNRIIVHLNNFIWISFCNIFLTLKERFI